MHLAPSLTLASSIAVSRTFTDPRGVELEKKGTKDQTMATPKQTRANRRNAGRSTGPKTAEGKARVARNALKHGILSIDIVLPDEDEAEFRAFDRRLREGFEPIGEAEEVLVDRIVATLWRLRRLQMVEAGMFAFRRHYDRRKDAIREMRQIVTGEQPGTDIMQVNFRDIEPERMEPFRRDPSVLAAFQRALACDQVLRSAWVRSARAFADDEKTFSALSRYEAGIERGLYKALHELERLQRGRRGESIPAPQAVDVNMDVDMKVAISQQPKSASSSTGPAVNVDEHPTASETAPTVNSGIGGSAEDDFEFEE